MANVVYREKLDNFIDLVEENELPAFQVTITEEHLEDDNIHPLMKALKQYFIKHYGVHVCTDFSIFRPFSHQDQLYLRFDGMFPGSWVRFGFELNDTSGMKGSLRKYAATHFLGPNDCKTFKLRLTNGLLIE